MIRRTIGAQPRERATRLDRRRTPGPPPPRPRDLLKLEREVGLATETAFDAYYRLRPTLRRIAAARLRARALDLDAPGDGAAAVLGPEAWAIVRPDLRRPRRHEDPGASLTEIEAAVTALERL